MACPCCAAPYCTNCGTCTYPHKYDGQPFNIGVNGLYEQTGVFLSCDPGHFYPTDRRQVIYANGVNYVQDQLSISWQAGFPDKLAGCSWALVRDSASVGACFSCSSAQGSFTTSGFGRKRRITLFLIECAGGTSTLVDITGEALSGQTDFPVEYRADVASCNQTPIETTTMLEYFSTPQITCNPLP